MSVFVVLDFAKLLDFDWADFRNELIEEECLLIIGEPSDEFCCRILFLFESRELMPPPE